MNFALLAAYVMATPVLGFAACVLLDHIIHGSNR